MKNPWKVILLALLSGTLACKKTIIGNGDKQVRFDFPGVASTGQTWITYGYMNHHKFNMDYYAGVDSVFLSVWAVVPKVGNKGTIELYNITDNTPITGSLIEVSANSTATLYQSANIKNNFPHKEITLGLRLTGVMNGELVEFHKTSLFIYKK